MAEDVTKNLSLVVIHGPKKYDVSLHLPSGEAGDALCVKHLTDKIHQLTDIPAESQKLIYKGKSLKDEKEELVQLGFRNGARVMLLGKKSVPEDDEDTKALTEVEKTLEKQPVPDDDEDTKALTEVEKILEKQAKKLSDITYELDGIHRGYLEKSQQAESVRQKEKQMAAMVETLMKLLEKLDSLRFEESNKGARGKRKTLVDKINVLLDRADGLSRGMEETKEKLKDSAVK